MIMMKDAISRLVDAQEEELKIIGLKVLENNRIDDTEALILFEKGSLSYLGALANFVRERMHGAKTFFNRNFHI